MIPQLQAHHSKTTWVKLHRNVLWKEAHKLRDWVDPPKDPIHEALRLAQQRDIDALLNQKNPLVTIERGLRLPVWDPVLLLPCTNLERHRLVKWRIAWLPPTYSDPPIVCQCTQLKPNREHFRTCHLTSAAMDNLVLALRPYPPPDMHLVDYALNLLPRQVPSRFGLWINMWQRLLVVLHQIDQATSVDTFEPEPPPGALLLAAYNKKRKQKHS
ncbi:hypothetical protein DFQ30_004622 [Apophysomyces sp. BC1015]|nr:hypothetical protein DFQ30_004622 [Apophysomyces sp. BC1015]